MKTWILALVLIALMQTGWKMFWSSRGFDVSLPDTPSRWSAARMELKPESTVLLGTSRLQAGIIPEVWADEMGGERPLQLSLVGTSPLPVMKHLAEETGYRGLAVVGITEMYLFDAESTHDRASRTLADYRNLTSCPSRIWGVMSARYLPDSVLMRHRRLNLRGVLEALWNRHAPENPANNMRPDRWIAFEADRVTADDLEYDAIARRGRPATTAERDSIIAELEECIQEIGSRGGTVVLVTVPACETRRDIEQDRFPRDVYWDVLETATSAPAINTYDYPGLLDFRCSDGSHIDVSDAAWFTRELAHLVRREMSAEQTPLFP